MSWKEIFVWRRWPLKGGSTVPVKGGFFIYASRQPWWKRCRQYIRSTYIASSPLFVTFWKYDFFPIEQLLHEVFVYRCYDYPRSSFCEVLNSKWSKYTKKWNKMFNFGYRKSVCNWKELRVSNSSMVTGCLMSQTKKSSYSTVFISTTRTFFNLTTSLSICSHQDGIFFSLSLQIFDLVELQYSAN